jgi:dihydrofolate reductase
MSARLSLIWAMGRNRVIGVDNRLPWRLPADLKRFRALTTGHTIVMGRKTYESFPRPLPDRHHVIVTTDPHYQAQSGCTVVHTLDAALAAAGSNEEAFVIGGASLYAQTLPRADRLYVTLIDADFDGDTRFPDFDWREWLEVAREDHVPDEQNHYAYSFVTFERRAKK